MCEWCGHEHAVTALCAKRPKWSRRGFLAMAGAALVGIAAKGLPTIADTAPVSGGWIVEPWETFQMNEKFLVSVIAGRLDVNDKNREVAFHARWVHPNGGEFVIAGDEVAKRVIGADDD
jgi:hypothetical protein